MIEKTVLDYLNQQLTEPVYMETPNPVPTTSYVLVEKTGSSVKDHIYKATLAVQSISDTLYNAALLNETVKGKMKDIISVKDVSRCALETDYNFTNTQTKQHRYQAVFNITYTEGN